MDNFMDRIAQKLGGSEAIKANAQAEAAENARLRKQVEEYERILQEMRKLSFRNTEIAEKITASSAQLESKLGQVDLAHIEEDKQLMARRHEEILEQFRASDDNNHRESVKVYRNVQAVVVDELKAQTNFLDEQNQRLLRKVRGTKPMVIVTMCLVSVHLLLYIADLCGFIDLVRGWF